jgi:hypothetical protein
MDEQSSSRSSWTARLAACWRAYLRYRRAFERSPAVRRVNRTVCAVGGVVAGAAMGASLGEWAAGNLGREIFGWMGMLLGGPSGYFLIRFLDHLIDATYEPNDVASDGEETQDERG